MYRLKKEDQDKYTKRYLTTDTLKTEFPNEFIFSKNRKFIEVLSVHLFVNDEQIDDEIEAHHKPKFITFHSDFVQDMRDLNCYVCLANYRLTKRKKYELLNNQYEFNLWFTDIDGTVLDASNLRRGDDRFYAQKIGPEPSGPFTFRRFRFFIELLLVY